MFAKTTAILAVFSLAAQVAVATPPACLIAAVNTQPDPSNYKEVCNSSDVVKYINSKCGDNQATANSAFAAVCKAEGITISSSSSSSSSSTSSSGSSNSASQTGSASSQGGSSSGTMTASSGSSTATDSSSSSSTDSPSSSSGSSSSGASSSGSTTSSAASTSSTSKTNGAARLGMDAVGLVAIGAFGAMLAL
ncbi:Hypothetical protein R9X50_00474000 [Acrodontium crateriforme]|uniref:Uncharacterized protein n=1 Tax=Acrodontium crateriforme TaxID=150365 RepID=A0AAQ3M8F9_9PEZI|nr:Hypothetical protein R9X50_00474000 [Acrodontium crateriforme]